MIGKPLEPSSGQTRTAYIHSDSGGLGGSTASGCNRESGADGKACPNNSLLSLIGAMSRSRVRLSSDIISHKSDALRLR